MKGRSWRVVEAQSKKSTTKLTDTLEEQSTLENIIENSKPPIPEECRHLSFLMLTPFRYSPYPASSRFRRVGSRAGVFYSGEKVETAVAEKVFNRLLFYLESPQTPWPTNPGEYSAFAVDFSVNKAIDLTQPPLNKHGDIWTHVTDYAKCLDLADEARDAGVEVIRYESVRDPDHQPNIAILTCRAFTSPNPVQWQTWHIYFSAGGVRAEREFPRASIAYTTTTFNADPRMKNFRWDRTL